MRALGGDKRYRTAAAIVQRLDLDGASDLLAGEDADEVVRAGDRGAVERQDDVAGGDAGAIRRSSSKKLKMKMALSGFTSEPAFGTPEMTTRLPSG
jgi:hypothetical protein